MNPYKYSITITQINNIGECRFKASIKELPDAADYAESWGEAYELAIETIKGAYSLFMESGRDFPKPEGVEGEY